MQDAFSRRSCGMDRSGVPMISEKRLAESSSRSTVFDLVSAAQSGAHASANANVKEIQRMDLAYYKRGAKWAKSHASFAVYVFGRSLGYEGLRDAGGQLVEGNDLVERRVAHDAGDEGGMHGVPGALGDDVTEEGTAQQGEVTDEIERLVAAALVGGT